MLLNKLGKIAKIYILPAKAANKINQLVIILDIRQTVFYCKLSRILCKVYPAVDNRMMCL